MPRPHVTLHFAQSLDGRIGFGPERERALLSSEQGLQSAHRARASHDAVLVGIETALHDDPRLTARAGGAQPLRVVLDSALRLPLSARMLDECRAGPILIVGAAPRAAAARRAALEAAGARVAIVEADGDSAVALGPMLELLRSLGTERLLVEGGARVLTSFLRERAADRAEIEIAPVLLGAPAISALGHFGAPALAHAPRLSEMQVERLGRSVLLCGDIVYEGEP